MRKALKGFFSLVLVVTMILACFVFAPTVNAATTENIVIEATSVDAMPGDTVTVDVNIKSNPGIVAMRLFVEYDTSVLTLIGAEDKGVLGENQFTETYGSPFALVWSNGTAYSNYTVTGTVATLTFKVAENVLRNITSEIKISTQNANDILSVDSSTLDLNPVTPSITNAKINVFPFSFANTSITMYDNIAMNFKVRSELFTDFGYTDPYVVFDFNGTESTQNVYTESGNQYSFTFSNIGPKQLKDKIKATLYATKAGELKSTAIETSVSSYCYGMLAYCTTPAYAELGTLLVDLLNYATSVQEYTGYKTNDLINAELTEAQKAMATVDTPTLASDASLNFKTIEEPSVEFTNIGLNLSDRVEIRFTIKASDITGLKAKIVSESTGYVWYIDAADFVKKNNNGEYYIYFNGFKATQMREIVQVSIVDGNTEVSNTARYDIESYAYAASTLTDPSYDKLKAVTFSMMKYGDSAYNYVF